MNTRKLMIACALIGAMALAGCAGPVESATLAPALSAPAAVSPAPAQSIVPQVSAGSLAALEGTFEQIYASVNPSVVNIQVIQNTNPASLPFPQGLPFGFGFNSPNQQTQRRALGSGFVWDTQGHIVTNNHVINGADQISVTFSDGTTVDGKLVGADPSSDLAVVQVQMPADQLHPVTVGDSSQVKVGQLAVAIGNPYGLSGTMTQGIVSALSRSLPVDSSNSNSGLQQGPTYEIPDIIQTDAAINPGNSGGVLVDAQGSVIGVTAAIQSPVDANSGIGFVIPSSIVEHVVPSLIKTGHYDHPWMGITGTTLTSDLASAMSLAPTQKGALVIDVVPNGPAAKAGLQGSTNQAMVNGVQTPVGGDVIVGIDGNPVNKFEDVSSYLINNTQVGQTVSLTVLRQGAEKTIQLTLGSLPQQTGQ
jgi:serine protease Do